MKLIKKQNILNPLLKKFVQVYSNFYIVLVDFLESTEVLKVLCNTGKILISSLSK